ncbi:MAG: DUF1552 domain-containing protein [Thermoguttaceae bacterium]|jgi:hypothetical protein
MSQNRQVSRRTVLRGIGTAIALPWLESIMPQISQAAEGGAPRRTAFFSVPNGIHMPDWTPKEEGPLDLLPPILAPLEPIKSSVTVLSGLTLDGGRPHRDGPGDHARSAASFLTGAHPYKTNGKDIRNGVSVDQAAAEKLGHLTRFASLELGGERSALAGNCDSGYSCAYTSNISWRTPTSPLSKEVNPRAVFDRLFSPAELTAVDRARRAEQERRRKSILDFAAEDAAELRRQLDPSDGRKLDEYLYAVREVERRLQKAEATASAPAGVRPAGTPGDFAEHVRLLMDMIVLAFQTDSTRIATFMYLNEGSNRSYPEIGVRAGHHELSHHGGNPEKQAQISKINRFHLGLLAGFLAKLNAAKEGDGTLLDSAMIMYGSGISDGNRHNHDDLPIVLAGRGGGTIAAGRHLTFAKETPLTNLYLAMLDRMGVAMPKFSDSTGKLEL